MENGEKILQEVLADAEAELALDQMAKAFRSPHTLTANTPLPAGETAKKDPETHAQWAIGGNGRFMPVGTTIPRLGAGVYEPFAVPGMWGLEKIPVASDGIHSLPDMATEVVLKEVQQFWESEARYRAHSLLYKRGLLLWGPPGGGKTVTVKLLMNELVKKDGVVVVVNGVDLTVLCLKAIRRIEPTRNLIVVFEDIDEIIANQGESGILSMLDGESNIDNVLHLATTNYPDRLGARIINRPSRFDRRVHVGMPGPEARRVYLSKTTNDGLPPDQLERWVTDTVDMSIAHLRELVAAVYCLDQPYEDVLERLKLMHTPVKAESGFKNSNMGFASPKRGRE